MGDYSPGVLVKREFFEKSDSKLMFKNVVTTNWLMRANKEEIFHFLFKMLPDQELQRYAVYETETANFIFNTFDTHFIMTDAKHYELLHNLEKAFEEVFSGELPKGVPAFEIIFNEGDILLKHSLASEASLEYMEDFPIPLRDDQEEQKEEQKEQETQIVQSTGLWNKFKKIARSMIPRCFK